MQFGAWALDTHVKALTSSSKEGTTSWRHLSTKEWRWVGLRESRTVCATRHESTWEALSLLRSRATEQRLTSKPLALRCLLTPLVRSRSRLRTKEGARRLGLIPEKTSSKNRWCVLLSFRLWRLLAEQALLWSTSRWKERSSWWLLGMSEETARQLLLHVWVGYLLLLRLVEQQVGVHEHLVSLYVGRRCFT